MKENICTAAGMIGGFFAALLGGWDTALITLVIFMAVDFTTGVISAALGKSKHSKTGRLSSKAGWYGLAKKFCTLLIIVVAVRMDILIGTKEKWVGSTVRSILTNEKYKGDALLQKTFTTDYLTKKIKKNSGQIPQYYVEESHEVIVSPEVFDAVQAELERRRNNKSRYSGVDILANKIICGECGSSYSPKVWHSTDQYRRVIYQCGHKYNGQKCSTPHLIAEEIHKIFIDAVNNMIQNKAEIIANLRESIKIVSDISALEIQRDKRRTEMEILTDMVEKLVHENARIAQDQAEYNKRYSSLIKRYEAEKFAYDAIEEQIANAHRRVQAIERFIKNVQDLGVLTKFDEELWGLLVESVSVYSKDDIRVAFKN